MSIEINVRQMVKEEVDKYIKELGFPIKEDKVGFEDDKIFLLSIEEYYKYKDVIPHINCWWWLRSRGEIDGYVTGVFSAISESMDFRGDAVIFPDRAIRPAIKFSNYLLSANAIWSISCNPKIGDRIMVYDFPWIVIDNGLAIAEVPITFDKFDDNSDDYKNSYVRNFLKCWAEDRE